MYRFTRRVRIGGSIRLHGEAGQFDKESVTEQKKKVSKKHANFLAERIYTHQCLPNISYLTSDEDRQEARGSKYMKLKARITHGACTNVDGSLIARPFFIGKSKKPTCFGLATTNDSVHTL